MMFYRYSFSSYPASSFDVHYNVYFRLEKFVVTKETPKGYWIKPVWDHRGKYTRWIKDGAFNTYAYRTKEEAYKHMCKRTEKRIKILEAKIRGCTTALREMKSEKMKKQLLDM